MRLSDLKRVFGEMDPERCGEIRRGPERWIRRDGLGEIVSRDRKRWKRVEESRGERGNGRKRFGKRRRPRRTEDEEFWKEKREETEGNLHRPSHRSNLAPDKGQFSLSFLSHLNIFINIRAGPTRRTDRMHYSTSCHHLIDLGPRKLRSHRVTIRRPAACHSTPNRSGRVIESHGDRARSSSRDSIAPLPSRLPWKASMGKIVGDPW